MSDWLQDLRVGKEQAIRQKQSLEDSLSQDHERILALTRECQVESALTELMTEVLNGHPLFPDAALQRTVVSRGVTTAEANESAPWSGAVVGNLLAPQFTLADGKYVTRITWKLSMAYRDLEQVEVMPLDITIAIGGFGIALNGRVLSEATADSVKSTITDILRQPGHSQDSEGHHRRRRRHRPWYKTLARRVLSPTRSGRLYLGVAVILILLALIIGTLAAQYMMRSAG